MRRRERTRKSDQKGVKEEKLHEHDEESEGPGLTDRVCMPRQQMWLQQQQHYRWHSSSSYGDSEENATEICDKRYVCRAIKVQIK